MLPTVRYSPTMVDNRAGVSPQILASITTAVAGHHTLQHALRWGFAQTPPRTVAGVIVQDEFTHDVILTWDSPLHLVYDTT